MNEPDGAARLARTILDGQTRRRSKFGVRTCGSDRRKVGKHNEADALAVLLA